MRSRHGISAKRGLLLTALCALALLAIPSFAAAKDRNHDRIPDKWEKRHDLSLKVNQAKRDQDRDSLGNRGEFKAGMDPRDRDSDDDGVKDGDENAGTIASFDSETGKLVIDLYGGDTVSGFVTEDTRIECGHARQGDDDSGATASRDDEDNSGSGSESSGPGSGGDDDQSGHDENDDVGGDDDGPNHDVGDDHGDHAEPGDDHGDHHGDADGVPCTTAALVEGAVVDEAELELSNGKAVFEEVELERSSSSTE